MAYIRELPPGVSTTVLLLGAAQFCNFRGSKKGGTKSKRNWVLFETFDTLHGSGSPDILSPFWNILSNWKSLGSKLLQNPGSLSAKIMTQTKEKKSIETVRRYKKFNVSLYSGRQISVVVSDVFEYFISIKQIVLILGSIFLRPNWRRNVNFTRHFFSKLRKSRKAAL